MAEARLSLRIDLGTRRPAGGRPGGQGRIGPGKVALLEAIARDGSISAAARSLKMSYRRAWELVEDLNTTFGAPVAATATGGSKGGGARLTPLGEAVVAEFRALESAAAAAAAPHLAALLARLPEA